MPPKEQVCRFAGEVDHVFIPDFLKLNRRTKAVRSEDIGKWSVVQFRIQVRACSAFDSPAENLLP